MSFLKRTLRGRKTRREVPRSMSSTTSGSGFDAVQSSPSAPPPRDNPNGDKAGPSTDREPKSVTSKEGTAVHPATMAPTDAAPSADAAQTGQDGQEVTASTSEIDAGRQCFVPFIYEKDIDESSPQRKRAVLMSSKLWVNNTTLRYFLAGDTNIPNASVKSLHGVVNKAMEIWAQTGIGIKFKETKEAGAAEIRIHFEAGGSWSYVGVDCLRFTFPSPTMNFGWDIAKAAGGLDTALHEIGHTLGMNHEHQNGRSGIEWDREAVYRVYGGPPNFWDRETTYHNILRVIPLTLTTGGNWDPLSVMHYGLPPGVVKAPEKLRLNGLRRAGGLSDQDIFWVKKVYPSDGKKMRRKLVPYQSQVIALRSGEQQDYEVRVTFSRIYRFLTFGSMDTKLILFLEDPKTGDSQYVVGDEDSGEDRNAFLEVRLFPDRLYILRLRLVYGNPNEGSVMMF